MFTITSVWNSAKLSFDIQKTISTTGNYEKLSIKDTILSILALVFFGWIHLLYFYVDRETLKNIHCNLIYDQRSNGMTKQQEVDALKIVDEYFGEDK